MKNDITTLSYDSRVGAYVMPEIEAQSPKPETRNPKPTTRPATWSEAHQGNFSSITTSAPALIVCGVSCALLKSFLPICVPLLGLASAILNWKNAASQHGMDMRDRKGRTNLPLYDIENDCMSNRFNH